MPSQARGTGVPASNIAPTQPIRSSDRILRASNKTLMQRKSRLDEEAAFVSGVATASPGSSRCWSASRAGVVTWTSPLRGSLRVRRS